MTHVYILFNVNDVKDSDDKILYFNGGSIADLINKATDNAEEVKFFLDAAYDIGSLEENLEWIKYAATPIYRNLLKEYKARSEAPEEVYFIFDDSITKGYLPYYFIKTTMELISDKRKIDLPDFSSVKNTVSNMVRMKQSIDDDEDEEEEIQDDGSPDPVDDLDFREEVNDDQDDDDEQRFPNEDDDDIELFELPKQIYKPKFSESELSDMLIEKRAAATRSISSVTTNATYHLVAQTDRMIEAHRQKVFYFVEKPVSQTTGVIHLNVLSKVVGQ